MIHRKEKKGLQVLRYRKLTKFEKELAKVFCLTRRLDGSIKFSKGFPALGGSFPTKFFFNTAEAHYKTLKNPEVSLTPEDLKKIIFEICSREAKNPTHQAIFAKCNTQGTVDLLKYTPCADPSCAACVILKTGFNENIQSRSKV